MSQLQAAPAPTVARPTPAAPAVRRGPTRWFGRFAVAFVAVVAGTYWLVEALELRFCQPFRCDHMNKVLLFQREIRRPSVVYLGTSQMHMGVIPAVVEGEAARRGKTLAPSYNLAVPGADLELSWIVARDTLTGDRRPQLMVVGVFPLIMAADRPSPAAEYLCWYGNFGDIADHVAIGDVFPSALLTAPFRGLENLVQYPLFHAKKPIQGFRLDYLRRSQGACWLPEDAAKAPVVAAAEWQRELNNLGRPQELVFRDDSRSARLLCSFRDLARARDMKLVVVYPPQHPDYQRLSMSAACEFDFRWWIDDFCRRQGIAYRDLDDPELHDHADYHDSLHFNARGADHFSRRLADVITPLIDSQ